MATKKKTSVLSLALEQGSVRNEDDAQRLRVLRLDLGDVDGLHGIEAFPNLEALTVSAAKKVSLAGIEVLRKLRVLHASSNATVADVASASALDELRELRIASFRSPSLAGLRSRSLRVIHFDGGLASVADLETPRLRVFECRENKIADLTPFAAMTSLRSLDIQGSPAKDLEPLRALTGLRRLSICGMKVKSIEALSCLQDLEHLVLTQVPAKDRSAVSRLPKLHDLLDAGRDTVAPASPPGQLDSTRTLRSLGYIDDPEEGAELASLGHHWAHTPVQSLRDLGALRGLRQLRLWSSSESFDGIEALVDLLELDLRGMGSTELHFEPLATLRSLRCLHTRLPMPSLEALPEMPELEHLALGFRSATSLRGLDRFPSLRTLTVAGPLGEEAIAASRPDLKIVRSTRT